MPKKLLISDEVPTLVLERLRGWGILIRNTRQIQQMRAQDLCTRLGISRTTLRRLEQGDPGAGAGLYLNVLMTLGVMDIVAYPPPEVLLMSEHARRRVRLKQADGLDDDF
ncbi:MAG: helix-turn-helix transcriptional regulator [Pseudomonadota bacterium]